MTDRNPDIHCRGCGKYLYSIYPRDPMPKDELCDSCKAKPAAKLEEGEEPAGAPDPDHLEHPTANRPAPWLSQEVRPAGEKVSRPLRSSDILGAGYGPASPTPPNISTTIANLFDILDGGWIERYHIKGQRMLTRQSVAEHSWRMAAIVFGIVGRSRVELVLATLFHDVSERVTGDMPAHVKRAQPDIAKAVNEVSTAEERRLDIRFRLSDEEQKLLAWVDRFEGALHCWDELEMGNRKVITTMERYLKYCGDKKYVLEDHVHEAIRMKLLNDLQQQVSTYTGDF